LRGIAFRAHNPLQNKATEIILSFLKYQLIYTYKAKKDLVRNIKPCKLNLQGFVLLSGHGKLP
jgi:hypothetical protein